MGLQLVQMPQKVPRACIFVQSANQICDCMNELLLGGDRRIYDQLLTGFLDGAAHVIGHTIDHLEGKIVGDVVVSQI